LATDVNAEMQRSEKKVTAKLRAFPAPQEQVEGGSVQSKRIQQGVYAYVDKISSRLASYHGGDELADPKIATDRFEGKTGHDRLL